MEYTWCCKSGKCDNKNNLQKKKERKNHARFRQSDRDEERQRERGTERDKERDTQRERDKETKKTDNLLTGWLNILQVGLDVESEAAATYKNVLTKLPGGMKVVEESYYVIQKTVKEMEDYIMVGFILQFGVC